MSISFDVASTVKTVDGTSGTTKSWTHTPTGTPTIITVNVSYANDAGNSDFLFVAGITYGGVPMTFVGFLGGSIAQEKWVLISPPSGPQSVALTWHDTGAPTDDVVARATSTTYISTNTPTYGTVQQATGSTSPVKKTVTGVLATSMLDTCGLINDGSSAFITVTVNGVAEVKRSGVTNFGNVAPHGRVQHYTSTQTGTGSVTANATESANRSWSIQVLELLEGAAPVQKTVSVLTSYSIGRFFDGGPEARERPEVAAAVWRGDRRFMRQGDSSE